MNDATNYIYSLTNFEKKMEKGAIEYSLDNIKKALNIFDNPQSKMKSIHIAGTKGKGSTAAMVSTLLRTLNYNISTFTSPHIERINERITSNLIPIEDSKFVELTNYIKEVSNNSNIVLTTFEFLFIMFLLFSLEKKTDYMVIESGLGGRLDSTNVIKPVLSVITSISYDHMDILGNSIEKIASEKGGIIKEGVPIILSKQPFCQAKAVIKKIAKEKNSKLYEAEKIVKIIEKREDFDRQYFDFIIDGKRVSNNSINLFGKHQLYNFASSLLAVSTIDSSFLNSLVSNRDYVFNIRGRAEIISKDPLIIVDVAHNGDSIDKLVSSLRSKFKNVKWRVLIGVAKNKDYKRILKGLKKVAKDVIVTNISGEKEGDIDSLLKNARLYFKEVNFIDNSREAFQFALETKEPLLIVGSFYIVAPFLAFLPKNLV